MARTLVVRSQPSLSNPKAELFPPAGGVATASIALTVDPNQAMKYTGDLTGVTGTYDVQIVDDFGEVYNEPGVEMPAGTDVQVDVPVITAKDATQIKKGVQHTYTSATGTSDVTITET